MNKSWLWLLALLIMVSAVIYQRTTGPTYPFRGTFQASENTHKYRLVRSQETTSKARVALPDPAVAEGSFAAKLHHKRYKTNDEFSTDPFVKESPQEAEEKSEYAAYLPIQPSAGKMEYFVTLNVDGKVLRIPAEGQENIVLRYKDPVPDAILWPHIFMMFFSVLIGMRAGLAALFGVDDMRRLSFIALGGMTIGGMILGPIVQKFAFGEYWTGFPFGGDLTDNKMLIMWTSWVIAAAAIGTREKKNEKVSRAVVLCAALVMTAVYLIPHSMRGSELDYSQVDQGVNPSEAIGTGD
jgi:hypothetical protein